MSWNTIDKRYRTAQTVAGKCSVRECKRMYKLILNGKELSCYGASSLDQATIFANAKLLNRAETVLSSIRVWKDNWTVDTPLGRLAVKLSGDGCKVKLGNKVIRNISEMSTLHSVRYQAGYAFEQLAKDLAAELS